MSGGEIRAWSKRVARASRLGYPAEFDPLTYLMHDVPADVLATATPKGEQSQRPFSDSSTFATWPAAVTVIAGRDDRFFPLEFQQELARTRSGVEPVVISGGHLAALSQPDELTAAILAATGG